MTRRLRAQSQAAADPSPPAQQPPSRADDRSQPRASLTLPTPVFQDGLIALYCGDSAQLVEQIVAVHGRPDHVFTDPPYSERVAKNARTSRGTKENTGGWIGAEAPRAFVPFATEAHRVRQLLDRANPRRWSVVFCDHQHAAALDSNPPIGAVSMRTGVWVKPDCSPQMTGDRPANGFESIAILHSEESAPRWNSGGKRGVWTHYVERDVPWHPTPKPVSLWRELVRDFTDPGDLIFDLYSGSGALGVAARFEGRRAVLVEIDQKYAALSAQRLREGRGREVNTAPIEEKRGTLPLFGRAP